MIYHHDTHKHIWKKIYCSYLNKEFQNSLPLIQVRNYAVVLCNDFMGILFFTFWAMWSSFKGPCDTKSFKISTAYDAWFSRYHPSNWMITADFALLLVFINFLWAVYANGARNHGRFISPWVHMRNNEIQQGAIKVQRSTKRYACTDSDRMTTRHHTSIPYEPLWSEF